MLREGDGEEKILDQGELWRLILSTAMCGFDFLPILQASEAENGQESGAPTSPEEEVHFAACGTRERQATAMKVVWRARRPGAFPLHQPHHP